MIREIDWVRYRHHFWELKRRLLDNSGSNDLLVRGGSGTTALVREVCADVREHFGTITWISIPQENNSAFIDEKILLQLIFERVAFPDMNTWMLKDHQFSLQQKARCLVVVDNLDDPKTWKKFEEILLIVKTCRVIFIARSNKDSSYSQIKKHSRDFESYELKDLFHLPAGHYLKNFLEKAFPSKRVYQLIVKKCQRLPTAIVFVLRNQYKQGQYPSSDIIKGEWWAGIPSDNLFDEFHVIQQVLKTLYQDPEGIDDDKLDPIQKVSKILREDNNIICLLYLSILPENRPLSCKTVSRLWAAEGFPINLERAEVFLKRLEKVCIKPVEKRSDGGFSTFQVDKSVRKILISLSDIITSQGGTNWPFRCLFVQGTIRAFRAEKTFELSSIFMPEVSSNEDETTTFEASPWDLKHSKVLDLTNASFRIIPDELFELTNARYLSLRNTPIKVIPGSIKKLRHLEFLDAKHSLVTKLPQQVARLKKIRHILIYHHEKDPMMENYNLIGFKASFGVGGLKHLEKLCFVEADKRTLGDLGKLTELRRLGITKLRKVHGKLLCSSLEKLTNLKSLNVHALDEDEILDLSSPPKSIERLYLHGRLEKLPDWISPDYKLKKIILRWSRLKEDLLVTLGNLPNLVELELHRAYDGERLDFKKGQFPTLKILLLKELQGLRSVSFERGTLPRLGNLTISRCLWLERIPSGIEHIHSIRKLSFFDISREFYEMLQADHEINFKIKPEVTQWKAGLHDHKKQLIKLLLKDNSITTDVLVQGGLGMTALVRNVCEDVHTREHFDTIVWITLPQEHDSELIREEILLQILFQNAPFPNDFDADHRVFRYFTNSSESNEARRLIVVDNLVDPRIQKTFEEVLHLVKTYKVIFMARREMGPPYRSEMDPLYSPNNGRQCEIYKLEDLSVEEPWAHFRLKTSPEEDFPSPLKEVCQSVLGKIKSLAEAIVLHLRSRKERNDEWAPMILSSDKLPTDKLPSDKLPTDKLPSDSLPKFNLIRQVLEILSNDRRPFCLLYLSNFPENRELSCNSVYRLWAAEGFLSNLGEAKGFLKVLLDRKCIHAAKRSDGELSTFRVDNLVREIIAPFSRHWKITSQGSKGVSDHMGATCQIIPDAVFKQTDVRCLILRDSSINKIQGSIENLKHLQFLDAKQSLVTELPPEVESLQNIRQILIYHHEKQPLMMESSELIGFKASCNVGEFQCLEKLCFVESDDSTLKHLANLKKLRRLGITKLTGEHAKSLCTCLEKLKQLESLNVHAYDEDELLNLDLPSSSPPVSLKRLYLHGRLDKLPNWISSLRRLKKIVLRWSRLEEATQEEEDLLATLGKLPNLVELQLRRAYKGRQLDFKGGQFPKLKILLLDELGRLRSISLAEGTMPHILDLTISRCPWLERIPTGIEHIIGTLKELEFFDMSREFYEMVPDDYRNSNGELKIHFTHWRPGQWKTIPLGIGNCDECIAGEH